MLLLGSYAAQKNIPRPRLATPPIPTRRSYRCETLRMAGTIDMFAAPCMPGQGCPIDPADAPFEGDCRAACDRTLGCRGVVFQPGSALHTNCYLYDDIEEMVVNSTGGRSSGPKSGHLRTGARKCVIEAGASAECPTPARNASLVLVLVMKYETHNLHDFMFYHSHVRPHTLEPIHSLRASL